MGAGALGGKDCDEGARSHGSGRARREGLPAGENISVLDISCDVLRADYKSWSFDRFGTLEEVLGPFMSVILPLEAWCSDTALGIPRLRVTAAP